MYNRANSEQGALLISALIIMTILAVLAAGVARVQGSRADIVAELANGYALDDLVQSGLNIAMGVMRATACNPENISDAVLELNGRTTIKRNVTDAGSLDIKFCPAAAACYATDWGVADKNVDWVVSLTSTIGTTDKKIKVGINSNINCTGAVGNWQGLKFTIAYWR
ncbi:MAG: hypothetical protein HQL70_06635 [Magnetococcales bacterium]|nr:hypothetical protein [Magnetococcales bacterium]